MMSKKNKVMNMGNTYMVDSPLPSNLTYNWNYGSLLGVSLVMQMMTGVTLAMHYTPTMEGAFTSMEHMMSDVNMGYMMSYTHANVASYFFMLMYLHMSSGMYYGSYKSPSTQVWNTGVMMFLLTMAMGFLGYTLPWGSMSFWGATVMTNLFSAMPWMGKDLVEMLWGSFCVDNATLNSFFSLHYLLPFGLAGVVMMHMMSLHENGSSNPLGMTSNMDSMPFHPYYTVKDMVGMVVYMMCMSMMVYYMPNVLNHTDNYMKGNPLVTPAHMSPEWYFLPYYAMLSSMPDKLMGVMMMMGSMLMLFTLNMLDKGEMSSSQFSPGMKMLFWMFMSMMVVLGYLGAQPVEEPYMMLGQMTTMMYFGWFGLVYMMSEMENKMMG